MIGLKTPDLLLAQQLEDYFNDYYKKNKKAVSIYPKEFPRKFIRERNLYKVLDSCPQFYRLTSRTYGLVEWLIDAVEEKIIENGEVSFSQVVDIARDTYGSKSVGVKNLKTIFLPNCDYYDIFYIEEIRKRYTVRNKQHSAKRSNTIKKNHNLKHIFRQPISVEGAAQLCNIDHDRLFLIANSYPYIHLTKNKKYYYSKEPKSTSCLIANLQVLRHHILIENTAVDLIYKYLDHKGDPLHIDNINRNMVLLGFNEDFSYQLENDSRFKLTGYNQWGLTEWTRYSKAETDFSKTLKGIKDKIGGRNWRILYMYEISTGKFTLQDIGDHLGITRERVRQILKKTKRRLLHRKTKRQMFYYIDFLTDQLNKHKVLLVEDLYYKYPEIFKHYKAVEIVNFLNLFNPPFEVLNDKYIVHEYIADKFHSFMNTLPNDLSYNQIKDFSISQTLKQIGTDNNLGRELFLRLVKEDNRFHIMKRLDRIYCKKTSFIKSDLAYIALKQIGEPAHYLDILEKYTELTGEETTGKLIQSYLGRNEGIVRVFMGTWGLKEWGCEEHIQVMDLTLEVLKRENGPMHYLEIYEKIKHRTMAKSSSIISLASASDEVVIPKAGYIALAKWLDEVDCEQKYGFTKADIDKNKRKFSLLSTFKNKYGYYVTKYKLSNYIMNRYSLRFSTLVDIELSEEITLLDRKGNIYSIVYSRASNSFFRLSQFFDKCEAKEGDILYFEFVQKDIIRVHTEEEYKNAYEIWDHSLAVQKDQKNKNSYQKDNIDAVLDFGLEHGYVYDSDILSLDEISPYINLTELLMDFNRRGIEIISK